jgi:hypothetical protein
LNFSDDVAVDSSRSEKPIRAMDDPVTDAMNRVQTVNALLPGAPTFEPIEQKLGSVAMIFDLYFVGSNGFLRIEKAEGGMLFPDIVVRARHKRGAKVCRAAIQHFLDGENLEFKGITSRV